MKRTAVCAVELPVAGRPVLVVGGGPAALGQGRAAARQRCGGDRGRPDRGGVDRRPGRAWADPLAPSGAEPADLDAIWLVVAATGDPTPTTRDRRAGRRPAAVLPARFRAASQATRHRPGTQRSGRPGGAGRRRARVIRA